MLSMFFFNFLIKNIIFLESKEALHLCISARSQELLSIACKHTEDLLKSIYQEFEVFCFERGLEPPNLQIRKVNVRTFQ